MADGDFAEKVNLADRVWSLTPAELSSRVRFIGDGRSASKDPVLQAEAGRLAKRWLEILKPSLDDATRQEKAAQLIALRKRTIQILMLVGRMTE